LRFLIKREKAALEQKCDQKTKIFLLKIHHWGVWAWVWGNTTKKLHIRTVTAGQPTTATMPSQWQLCNAKLSGVFDAQIPQLK